MFEYIKGNIIEINPAYVIVETYNIGYYINISISTFSQLQNKREVLLYLHQIIKEDANLLYGFYTKEEREIFRNLITVNGVGPNTARMILSSYPYQEIHKAIKSENVKLLQSIKGIGLKTAQRIIIELKDKISKEVEYEILSKVNNTIKNEALLALNSLGFKKGDSEKVINKILLEETDITLEELIKKALKYL